MRCISHQFKKKKKYSDIFVHWDQSHLIFLNSGAHNSQRAITTRVLLFFFFYGVFTGQFILRTSYKPVSKTYRLEKGFDPSIKYSFLYSYLIPQSAHGRSGASIFSRYRKIPKISPGAYIFQRPFLRGLCLERSIFGGAYVRSKICVSKSIGLACSGKVIYHFCFVLLCIRGQIPRTSPLGGLYSEGRFNGGF